MTKIEVFADSKNSTGDRLTTFLLTYPRFIHAQILTHRMFSRNSQSSRAVPVKRLIELVRDDPYVPTVWGRNQRGMVAGVTVDDPSECVSAWMDSLNQAIASATRLADLGVSKQWANRLLEPYSYITTIITATEWENFFLLRCADDTQPELQDLALGMQKQLQESTPTQLGGHQWHLPFIDPVDRLNDDPRVSLIRSVARCARLSYRNFEGTTDYAKDEILFNTLASERHWSPLEHQATPSIHNEGFVSNLFNFESLRRKVELGYRL